MNQSKAVSPKIYVYCVAIALLAALSAPAFAQVASPSSVSFYYVQRAAAPNAQPVTISNVSGSSTVTAVTVTQPVYTPPSGQACPVPIYAPSCTLPLFVTNFSGNVINVGVDASTLYYISYYYLPAGTYNGSMAVTAGGTTITVPLAITVNVATTFSVSPTSLNFNVTATSISAQQTLTLSNSGTASVNFTATSNATWLLLSTTSGTVTGTAFLTVTASGFGLANGTYNGTISISPSGGSTVTVAVTMVVGTGFSNLTASPSTLNFSTANNTQTPFSQTLYISSQSGSSTLYLSTLGSTWLTLGATAVAGPSNSVTVGVNPFGLSNSSSYNGTIRVTTNNDTSTLDIPVTLTIGTSSSALTLSPSTLTLSTPSVGVNPGQSTINVAAQVSGLTFSAFSNVAWLSVSSSAQSGSSATFLVSPNVAGLGVSSYSGVITITATTVGSTYATAQMPVILIVGGGGTGGTGSTINPASLTFSGQAGASLQPNAQFIVLGGSGIQYTATVGSGSWLKPLVNPTGATPGTIGVEVNTQGLTAGSYSGSINVNLGGNTTAVPVTLSLSANPTLIANPGAIVWNFYSTTPTQQALSLSMSDGSSAAYTAVPSVSWITVAGRTSGTTPASLALALDPTTLPSGVTVGQIAITAGSGQTVNVPVIANVQYSSGTSGNLLLTPSSLSFSFTQANAGAQQQYVTVSSTSTTAYYVSSSASWLSLNPQSSTTTSVLTVTANPSGLSTGTYSATITLVANGVSQSIPVSMTVGGATALTLSPTALTFSYQVGGGAPAAQQVAVTSQSGSSVTFTTTASTNDGASWLAVTPGTGATSSTAVNLQVSVLSGVLTTAGTYTGVVSVTPVGGTVQTVNVTVTVTAPPSVTASPKSLTFNYRAGDATPAPQSVQVTSSNTTGTLSYEVAVATQTGTGWLSATPLAGTAPGTVTVNVTPGNLDPGTYTGTVTISGASGAAGSSVVQVSITVTAPLPTITRLVNAASFASGAISPGEIVTLAGTAIGPTDGVQGGIDSSTGRYTNTVSGVQVTFNGLAGPVIYASATQVSAIVPYEVAGRLDAVVQVRYRGTSSNALTVPITTTVPGVFTQNSSGSGPAVAQNQDGSLNGAGNPAAKGSVIVIYATGEGITQNLSGGRPVTGNIINVVSVNDLPRPLLPVAVKIDGLACTVAYAGAVNGLVAGVLQLNVIVPQTNNSGPLSLEVSVGGNSSQPGITVAVR